MTKYLITGGTGSLGNALTPYFLQDKNNAVTILSRDPHKQTIMKRKYPQVKFVLGDIRNRDLMLDLCAEAEVVIHAAALKIVGDAQHNVKEYHSVNVLGALTVAEACRLTDVNKALFISSDKACSPANQTYGKTKAIAEDLWLAQNTHYRNAIFSCIRYGNVVCSNGSVYHIWKQLAQDGKPITVKYPEPTRFILTMNQAVELVINALQYMVGGEIFVPGNVPAFSLWDLAREFQAEELWKKEPLLPGEKQHEVMIAPTEYATPARAKPIVLDGGITLWLINPAVANKVQETPPMFSSLKARKVDAETVIRMVEYGSAD